MEEADDVFSDHIISLKEKDSILLCERFPKFDHNRNETQEGQICAVFCRICC